MIDYAVFAVIKMVFLCAFICSVFESNENKVWRVNNEIWYGSQCDESEKDQRHSTDLET